MRISLQLEKQMKLFVLKHRITDVMIGPHRANKNSPLAWILWLISKGYGAGEAVRSRRFRTGAAQVRKLPCLVVSVGNITAGGAGKTPMTLYLARLLQQAGKRTAVVSRGYKGQAGKKGAVVSKGGHPLLSPAEAGDEPFLMSQYLKGVPVIVGHDRFEAGKKAVEQFKSEIILLDDGFQHRQLFRDIDIVLLDARAPFGNTHLVPRGVLREPLTALDRADMFILTRSVSPHSASVLSGLLPPDRPVFSSVHRPSVRMIIPADGAASKAEQEKPDHAEYEEWKHRKGFAFSGIARNEDVRRSIHALGFSLNGFLEFPDHHAYSPDDLKKVISAAQKAGADFLLTTDKDFVRIPEQHVWPTELAVIGVDIDFGEEQKAFDACFLEKIERILS